MSITIIGKMVIVGQGVGQISELQEWAASQQGAAADPPSAEVPRGLRAELSRLRDSADANPAGR